MLLLNQSQPLAIVAFVVAVVGFRGGVGGIYYAATGNFVVHILVVFVIEIFIPRICMHRLAVSLTQEDSVHSFGSVCMHSPVYACVSELESLIPIHPIGNS